MLDLLTGLSPEIIASGIVGLVMAGIVARNAILGWYEANKKMKESDKAHSSMATAVSIGWDKNQIERALQTLEKIAECLEAQTLATGSIAKAQGIMSDQFQQSTQSKLEHILERLEQAERTKPRSRP